MAEQANWYVAHTYSGYENKVATDLMTMVENRHLQDLICDVKVPTETRMEEVFDNHDHKTGVPCPVHAFHKGGILTHPAFRAGAHRYI